MKAESPRSAIWSEDDLREWGREGLYLGSIAVAAGLVVGGVLSRVDCQRKERAGAISHDIKGDDGMDGEIRSGREGAAAQGVLRSSEGSGKDRRAQLYNDYVIKGTSAPGLVNFVIAVAYHFCPSLPAAFTQPGATTFSRALYISLHSTHSRSGG